MAGIGDNSNKQLQSFVDRVERLAEERKGINDDIRDVMAEAKATGFDTKTIRKVIALRKLTPEVRREQQAILETYLDALGILD